MQRMLKLWENCVNWHIDGNLWQLIYLQVKPIVSIFLYKTIKNTCTSFNNSYEVVVEYIFWKWVILYRSSQIQSIYHLFLDGEQSLKTEELSTSRFASTPSDRQPLRTMGGYRKKAHRTLKPMPMPHKSGTDVQKSTAELTASRSTVIVSKEVSLWVTSCSTLGTWGL